MVDVRVNLIFPVLLTIVSSILSELPRGVPQSKAVKFVSSNDNQFFSCDEFRLIAFEKINDDFCDCIGGEDEPGTSACAAVVTSNFYCVNKGHRGRWIHTSWVDDGICDCCDGSDESDMSCDNTCDDEANVANAAASLRVRMLEDGAREKARYIELGHVNKKTQQDRIGALSVQIDDIRSNVATLEASEQELEVIQERWRKEHRHNSNLKGRMIHQYTFPTLSGLGLDELRNLLVEYARRVDLKGKQLMCLVTGHNEICSQDIGDSSSRHDIGYDDLYSMDHDDSDSGHEYDDIYDSYGYGDEGWNDDYGSTHEEPSEKHSFDTLESDATYLFAEEDDPLISNGVPADDSNVDYLASDEPPFELPELLDLRNTLSNDRKKLKSLETEKRNLEDDLAMPIELFPLKGKCFSIHQHSYEYEMCPFREASQIGEGGARTRLGIMDELAEIGSGDLSFTFSGGAYCYNGPDRSLVVDVVCGITDEILEVDEPRTCEYTMRFSSPVACDIHHAKGLELEKLLPNNDVF